MDEHTDRYASFRNIDCAGKARLVIEHLQPLLDAGENPFWAYFRAQRQAAHAKGFDDLRVLHNYLPTLRELLSEAEAHAALALLEDLEVTCM